MVDLLGYDELPFDMQYPPAFLRMVDRGIVYIEPWYILDGAQLRDRLIGMIARYPERQLLPFARREDNDDVACWDAREGGKVLIIHDFASSGHELRDVFDSFYSWLRKAVEDMIEFDSYE